MPGDHEACCSTAGGQLRDMPRRWRVVQRVETARVLAEPRQCMPHEGYTVNLVHAKAAICGALLLCEQHAME